jgi:hypothetical protein
MQAGPCIPVGVRLEKAEVRPTSGPTWCLSHLGAGRRARAAAGRQPSLAVGESVLNAHLH